MRPRDVELAEALTGDLLEELGYERAFPTISPALRAEAARYRDWWTRKLARREARTGVPRPQVHEPSRPLESL